MTDTKPYLQIKGLAKKYGDNLAVKPLELDIYQHEIFALLGSSGSGKSTLLRMLAKLSWTDKILPIWRLTIAPSI